MFAYLVSSGAADLPPIGDVGFVAGPFLVGAGRARPGRGAAPEAAGPSDRPGTRWHLLVPYVPLAAVGVLLVVQTSMDRMFDRLEVYLGLLVVTLVVTRQFLTLRENTILLERVQQGQEELSYQAFHDPLTGLPNRTLFGDRLAHAADLHRDDRRPIGLLFVDLDDFKIVNDTLGHAAGDVLLRQVGERLRGCVPAPTPSPGSAGTSSRCCVESDLDSTVVARPRRRGAGPAVPAGDPGPVPSGEHRRSWCRTGGTRRPRPSRCCAGPTRRCTRPSGAAAARWCATSQG